MEITYSLDFNEIPEDALREFYEECGEVPFFQSPDCRKLTGSGWGAKCVSVIAREASGRVIGVIVGTVQRFAPWPMSAVASRVVVIGGPVMLPGFQDYQGGLLHEFIDVAKGEGAYIEIRNTRERTEEREVFEESGFEYEDHLDILIDLRKGPDALWKELHSTRRKQIKRAGKRGVVARLLETRPEDEEFFEQSVGTIERVYRRVGLPCPGRRYFRSVYERLAPARKLLVFSGIYEGRVVGARMVLRHRGALFDWYAGSDPEHSDKYVNDLLPWEAIRWGAENGCTVFDFGGAGKPNVPYGVRDHKMKFGGRLVNPGRFTRVNNPLLFQIGLGGLYALQRLKAVRGKG